MKKNYWSVDRIEGDLAVCIADTGERKVFPLSQLPLHSREGTVFAWEDNKVSPAPEEEEKRRERIRALESSLFDQD